MTQPKPYLNQYFEMKLEWERNRIDIDTAPKEQIEKIQALQEKAIKQSGLTINELALICRCRLFRISRKVNTYAASISK